MTNFYRNSIFLLLLVLGFALSACRETEGFRYLVSGSLGDSKGKGNDTDTDTDIDVIDDKKDDDPVIIRTDVADRWTQPTPGTYPLDLIFLMDTSGSLNDERAQVASSLSTFLGQIESYGIHDYCIGVMEAHMGAGSGVLVYANNGAVCLCSTEMTKENILNGFQGNLDAMQEEYISDGGEAGFPAMQAYLNDRALRAGTTSDLGCFRSDAALALVAISDENEMSTSGNSPCTSGNEDTLSTFVFVPEPISDVRDRDGCREASARASSTYSEVNSDNGSYELFLDDKFIYDLALNVQGERPFRAATIGYITEENFRPGYENGIAHGYIELAGRSSGYTVEIANAVDADDFSLSPVQRAEAQAEFDADLGQLGASLAQGATLLTSFALSKTVCEDRTPKVKIDGVLISSQFDREGNRVTISEDVAGNSGSEIRIRYETCRTD